MPQRYGRARQDVPASGALLGVDDAHGHGDGDRAEWHLYPWVLAAGQGELAWQAAEVRQARQETHHIDELARLTVPLHHLRGAETGAACDIGKIKPKARVVTGGNAPAPAGEGCHLKA